MDWTDMIFGKKTLADLARDGSQTQQQPSQPANLNIGQMAQDQANRMNPVPKVKSAIMGSPVAQAFKRSSTVDNQPTMKQLQGTGATCPTCGSQMK